MADLRTAANEADRIWSNEVLRLIQRRFPHIPMSEFGDEPRAALLAFARDVTALAQAEPVQPVASKYRVMVCGVDCHPGDQHCNGYCTGKTDDPPEATAEQAEAFAAQQNRERPSCDECGKSKADGWALYCVECLEKVFTAPQRAEPVQADEQPSMSMFATKADYESALAQAEPVQDLIPPDSLFVCDQMGAHVTRVRLEQRAEPERNFCPRCGKRLADEGIHTCTPPQTKCEHCSSPLFAALECRVCGRKEAK